MTRGAEIALDQLRAKLRGEKVPEPPPFQPPGPDEFARDVSVLAFDPSLLHTGVVYLLWHAGMPQVQATRQQALDIRTREKGYKAIWDTASRLQRKLRSEVFEGVAPYVICALEAPPVGNSKLHRTDSSLIAGTIIYAEAAARGMEVREASVNHVSSVLLGNVSHDKKEIAAALAGYIPDAREWTEAECDAAAVGLTVLYDLRRQ